MLLTIVFMQFRSNIIEQGRGLCGGDSPAFYRLLDASIVSIFIIGGLHVQRDGEREGVVLELTKRCVG